MFAEHWRRSSDSSLWDFVILRKLTGFGSSQELGHSMVCYVLPSANVHGDQPSFAPPAPCGHRADASIFAEFAETNDCLVCRCSLLRCCVHASSVTMSQAGKRMARFSAQ